MGAVAGRRPDSPDKKAPGMRRGGTQQAEDWAVRRVNDVVADDMKWFSARSRSLTTALMRRLRS
jgi:hypothetical protein